MEEFMAFHNMAQPEVQQIRVHVHPLRLANSQSWMHHRSRAKMVRPQTSHSANYSGCGSAASKGVACETAAAAIGAATAAAATEAATEAATAAATAAAIEAAIEAAAAAAAAAVVKHLLQCSSTFGEPVFEVLPHSRLQGRAAAASPGPPLQSHQALLSQRPLERHAGILLHNPVLYLPVFSRPCFLS